MNNKKLYRNTDDKMVAGVLSGLAEYFGWDVTIVRLGFVGVMLITRIVPLAILYIFAAFIIPEKPKALETKQPSQNGETTETYSPEQPFKVGDLVLLTEEGAKLLKETLGVNTGMPFKIQEIVSNPPIQNEKDEVVDEGGETVVLSQDGKTLPAISITLVEKYSLN